MSFEEKYFSDYILVTDQISLADFLFLEVFGNVCIVIICCSVCDVINFEINHSFLMKAFFQRVRVKMYISQERKEL